MHRTRLALVAPAVIAVAVAGCGSSGSHKTASSSAAQAASSNPYGGPAASTATPSSAPAALITTKHDPKLGTILAFGPKHLTVYLFEADKPGVSNCTGECAVAWPPVVGSPKAQGAAASADLGTITRPDGTKQVTYNGHPLYLFIKDKDGGDSFGQGVNAFGAAWYALAPSGNKVDNS